MSLSKNDTKKIMLGMLTFCVVAACPVSAASDVPDDALTVIHSRKSVRHFTGRSVDADILTRIVRAGMAAPAAENMHAWSFVIVTGQDGLKTLAAGLPYAKMLDQAGAAIVVCALPEKAYQKKAEFAILNATCASENMLLAIEALKLGGVWTAVYPEKKLMAHVRGTLGIPENVIPLNVIPVGYPTGVDRPKDKFNPENMHWEQW